MTTNEVLLVCDWAMKFLPRKFREDQCDWFGKRGIPWHITMVFCRKEDGTIGSLGFVHLFANQTPQDSHTSAAIIRDVMTTIQHICNPGIKFHLWSDNAGCYKSTEMLSYLFHSGLVVSYNFCEAQNGKGPCDRTAATIKSSVRRYVNQGHDVLSAHAMKEAIEKSAKNVKYRVCVVEGCESTKNGCESTKGEAMAIPGISTYNNFTFSQKGITAWKAYKVGEGKLGRTSSIPQVVIGNLTISEAALDVNFHQLSQNSHGNESVHTCSNSGCTLTFSNHQELSCHLMFGKCQFAFECQSSDGSDVTKRLYLQKVSKSFESYFHIEVQGQVTKNESVHDDLDIGWALKEWRKTKRFNENQRQYLTEIFDRGLLTGRKEDPYAVAEAMLCERMLTGVGDFPTKKFSPFSKLQAFSPA